MMDDDEIPSNFFISEEYILYSEQIGPFTQEFYASPAASTDYDLTGQVLWPGAKHLSEYFSLNPEVLSHKTILEVGSGSGLCGLYCSHLAEKTILSDGNDIVMRLLEKNKEFGKNIEIVKIDWCDENPGSKLSEKNLQTTFEYIIGADVVYWSSSIVPLFNTVNRLLSNNGKFIMCYTLRANNIYRDLIELSQKLGFSNVLLWQQENTFIFCFERST